MNPLFLDNMSWEMAEVYGAITDQILINLAKYFPYYKAGNVPRSAFTYQAAMLAQMGQVNRETVAIIRNNLQGANKALMGVLEQTIIDAVSKAEPGLLKAVKAGILNPAGIPIVSPTQMRAFNLYYQQAAQKLNLVNTVMLESTKQAYQATVANVANLVQTTQTALDIGAGETITGVSTWNQAVRHSIDRMKENGITGFIDHGNHKWSAEAYVSMDIRTTVYNTGRAAVWETNQSFGNDLYIVSYHDGARPLCYPWQNKVISSINNDRIVKDLDGNDVPVIAQSDTSYGQPAGLFGINCKHYPSPFIPGVSVLYDQGNILSEKQNEKVYEQTQQQRALERKLREEKRDLLMEKARGADQETIKALRERCRRTSDDIDAFCEETGLPRRQNREGVFTKRDFPAADTYDPKAFERTQKDEIDKYFRNSGVQQNYSFAQMTPNGTIEAPVPKTFTTEKDFDDEIARIRKERQAAFDSDNYDKAKTDQQLQYIFDLEDRKKAFLAQKEKEALDASVITTRPENEQAIMKQFNRFDTSKRTDAQMLAQVNPHYSEGTRAWTHNCQRTVAAQEAVYRGYDVTAKAYNASDAIKDEIDKVFVTTQNIWDDPGLVPLGNASTMENKLVEAFTKWGDGSRGVIRVYWSSANGSGGHFLYARNVGGQIIVTDPQDGYLSKTGITEYLKDVTRNKHQMWVMRVDNRPFTDNIGLAIENRGD